MTQPDTPDVPKSPQPGEAAKLPTREEIAEKRRLIYQLHRHALSHIESVKTLDQLLAAFDRIAELTAENDRLKSVNAEIVKAISAPEAEHLRQLRAVETVLRQYREQLADRDATIAALREMLKRLDCPFCNWDDSTIDAELARRK